MGNLFQVDGTTGNVDTPLVQGKVDKLILQPLPSSGEGVYVKDSTGTIIGTFKSGIFSSPQINTPLIQTPTTSTDVLIQVNQSDDTSLRIQGWDGTPADTFDIAIFDGLNGVTHLSSLNMNLNGSPFGGFGNINNVGQMTCGAIVNIPSVDFEISSDANILQVLETTSTDFIWQHVGAVELMRLTYAGSLGIGEIPVASAILDVASTTQGFLPPRMTTTQKNAISSPATGLEVYDTTLQALCVYNGTTWTTLSTGGGSGTVNSGTAGRLSLYATSTNAVSDTYVQNVHNITLSIATQGSRSTDLALTIPNPGNAITSSNVVLDQGAYTIAGQITYSLPQIQPSTTNASASGTLSPTSNFKNYLYTLSGNLTINGPSSPIYDGQEIIFRIQQAAVGGPFTVTFATGSNNFSFGTTFSSYTMTATSSAFDLIGAKWNATASRWNLVSLSQGF